MKTLELNRTFLKKPFNGVTILFIIVLLYELLSWAINPDFRLSAFEYSTGIFSYVLNWVFGLYLPELITLYIVVLLLDRFHAYFKIGELPLTTRSIASRQRAAWRRLATMPGMSFFTIIGIFPMLS